MLKDPFIDACPANSQQLATAGGRCKRKCVFADARLAVYILFRLERSLGRRVAITPGVEGCGLLPNSLRLSMRDLIKQAANALEISLDAAAKWQRASASLIALQIQSAVSAS